MPYNTTAIPPRKEATGQTQLPLSRVKKIIAQDPDVSICSNNAAFVITLATEMFIQYLATEGLNAAKLERKPRRNIQYKDVANAVSRQDNLEFLSDMVPKMVPIGKIRAKAAAKRAQLQGAAGGRSGTGTGTGVAATHEDPPHPRQQRQANGSSGSNKKHKSSASAGGGGGRSSLNGGATISGLLAGGTATPAAAPATPSTATARQPSESVDPNDQLQFEARQARGEPGEGGDVEMTG